MPLIPTGGDPAAQQFGPGAQPTLGAGGAVPPGADAMNAGSLGDPNAAASFQQQPSFEPGAISAAIQAAIGQGMAEFAQIQAQQAEMVLAGLIQEVDVNAMELKQMLGVGATTLDGPGGIPPDGAGLPPDGDGAEVTPEPGAALGPAPAGAPGGGPPLPPELLAAVGGE